MDLKEVNATGHRHPWEVARFEFFFKLFAKHGWLGQPIRVLDVGAGDAWFSHQLGRNLPQGSAITCVDTHYGPEKIPTFPAYVSSSQIFYRRNIEENSSFFLFLLLDVLEHIENDCEFLKKMKMSVVQNGHIVVSVPAWQRLYSSHDRFLEHFRRYSPAQARALIQKSGLKIEMEGGLFFSLLPVRWLSVLIEKVVRPEGQLTSEWRAGRLMTAMVLGVLKLDSWLCWMASRCGLTLPGLSYWALCRI